MSETHSEESTVEEELDVFLETLRESETYQQVIDTQAELEADSEAMELLDAYQQKQQQLQEEFDPSVMSKLRELQTELSNNETIQRHQAAQEDLVDLLKQTNDVISEQIGQEFAQSLGGGCC